MKRKLSMRTTDKIVHLSAGVLAVFALTGADAGGCAGETEPPAEPSCPEGEHLETECDEDCGMGEPGNCYDTCVPDSPCPDGYYEEWTCEPSYGGGFCLDPDGCEQDEPAECYPTCVPEEVCGPGMHEEIVCAGDGMGEPPPEPLPEPLPDDPPPEDPGMGGPPSSGMDECTSVCVPDAPEECPPDTMSYVDCMGDDCVTLCAPVEEP